MRLELIRGKKKNETNDKNKKIIPAKRQRLRIKVSNFGKIQLKVEEIKSKEKIVAEVESDDELSLENVTPKKLSMKKRRQKEKSSLPHSRSSRNRKR